MTADFIRSQLIEIIEWIDPPRDAISFRFPDDDREIKRGAKLVVRESQAAQFVYLGQFADLYGPGTHTLTTDNIPLLTRLRGWKYGFESPFKADVFFLATRLFTGQKWGTSNPVMVRDPELGVVRLRAFGVYDFRVREPQRFLRTVAGTDDHFTVDQFADAMRSRIVSVLSQALATSKIPALDIAARYREVGDALLPIVNAILTEQYGVELASFVVENVSVPAEVEQALDKRSSMAAIGDLNEFVKYQMSLGLEHGAGVAAVGAEMAVGAGIAQQFLPRAATAPVAGAEQILTPAEAAAILRVSEADVTASLDKGDLKGKKIGGQWRVTRAAVDDYLR
ncbi:MAG TPA: SPFH and helix-turn-helix domain-containing protein [Vicinamibacterales bacterium]|jgi:excisionase family DNA binding protein|nr:SPFH and helix-turn-helix domain-containing protein [Vicinamibacterales bacterium]